MAGGGHGRTRPPRCELSRGPPCSARTPREAPFRPPRQTAILRALVESLVDPRERRKLIFSCPIRAEARESAENAAYARPSIAMLWRLLILSGAAGALRAPGRSGSLPKKPQRGGRVIDTAELFVANLPDSDRDDFLEFARSAFPAVRRVTVPRDRSTGAARGFVRDPCRLLAFQPSHRALSHRRSSRCRATTCPRPSRPSTARCWARSGLRRGQPTSAPRRRPIGQTGRPTP